MKLFLKLIVATIFLVSNITAQETVKPIRAVDLGLKKKSLNGFSKERAVYANQGQFDARYYKIELNIDFTRLRITGRVSARVTALVDNLEEIVLDLDRSMIVSRVGADADTFSRGENTVILTLNHSVSAGEDVSVVIEYAGYPGRSGWFKFDLMPGEGTPMATTLCEPYGAPFWWPCKDTPADKADSVDILLTVPQGYIAASNGILVSEITNNDGTATFHWHEQYPIATYLVSLVAGTYYHFTDYYHYTENDSMLLDYYVYPNRAAAADTVFDSISDHLSALSYFFGPYPFLEEKYGLAQFSWAGGMEHQTLTSIGYVTPAWEYIYVHELGHQWFGDQITCASWRDIWLNEGFASYSEPLYAQWAGFAGYPPGMDAYHAYMGTQKYFKDGTIIREDTLNIGSLFDRIVYEKGAWVLHMLRHITGDDVFFDILKTYLNDPRWTYGSVRTENFIEICEMKSGLNLQRYFDQWLNFPYYPKYEYGWKAKSNGSGQYNVEVMIAQSQSEPIYEMPVDLTFRFVSAPDTTLTVLNNTDREVYTFTLDYKPIQLFFDKEEWILKSVNELPYKADNVMLEIDGIYPTPFSQTVTIRVFNWTQLRHKLDIYDPLGRKVRTINEYQMENNYSFSSTWDGKNDQGVYVASGVYFIRPYIRDNGVYKFGNPQKVIYLK
jgi:aminopeptidase N